MNPAAQWLQDRHPRCTEPVDTSTAHAELMRAQACKIHMSEAICLIPSMIDVFHLARLQQSFGCQE
jgi:hypothetical protein